MLDFRPITLEDKERIERYSFRYAQNSCQHTFVSMYAHFGKYGDSYAEKDGRLYICRTRLGTDRQKVYLFPMGDMPDVQGLRTAINELLADASREGKRAVLYTITEEAKGRLEQAFPGKFDFCEERDCFEYLYLRRKLADLSEIGFQVQRRQYRLFYRKYAGRVMVETITPKIIPQILEFQQRWMDERMLRAADAGLYEEDTAIRRELLEYQALGLFGIVIRVDGKVAGYAFGAPVSDDCFDLLAEKGDRSIAYIYRALKRELPERCGEQYRYINWEEDVGSAGLREMKLRYRPDILMKKYTAREVTDEKQQT